MGLIKGSVSLTRYRVVDAPPEITDEFLADRLHKSSFMDIETSPEEESIGWVEILNPLSTEFEPYNFNFGEVIALNMRIDTRKVSAKMVNRYFSIAEMRERQSSDKPLSAEQKRELKARIKMDLLSRTPVATDVFEVCWFPKNEEVWLISTGPKIREKFEDLWRRTFNLGIVMKIPYVLAREVLPDNVSAENLDQAKPSALLGGVSYESR